MSCRLELRPIALAVMLACGHGASANPAGPSVAAGAPLTNSAFGLLKGNGTLSLGGATFTNNGTVGPGASAGTLTISGNYVQGPDGTLAVELGGTTPGTDFDVLKVTGNATLDGTLVVTRTAGTTLTQGSEFEFLTYGSRSGDFAAFSVPPGFAFETTPGPTSYTLSNTIARPPEISQEASAISQRDAVLLIDRVFVTDTADNTDTDVEKRRMGECR